VEFGRDEAVERHCRLKFRALQGFAITPDKC
jgi:hypothetical protein